MKEHVISKTVYRYLLPFSTFTITSRVEDQFHFCLLDREDGFDALPWTSNEVAEQAEDCAEQEDVSLQIILTRNLLANAYDYSSNENATESPLLRLPAEIRNRVYGYVLGGKTLHIIKYHKSPSKVVFRYNTCRLPEADSHQADCVRENGSENTSFDYIKYHEAQGCRFAGRDRFNTGRLDIQLLRVCRQIHREAALIPYTMNTFSFNEEHCIFCPFLNGLMASQQRALRGVTFYCNHGCYVMVDSKLRKRLISGGLEDLTIYGWHFNIFPIPLLAQEALQRLPFKKARVCITAYPNYKNDSIYARAIPVQSVREESRAVENKIEHP